MKKRIVSILLIAVLIASACTVFAACGKKADTKATTAPTTAAATVATTAPTTANGNAPTTANGNAPAAADNNADKTAPVDRNVEDSDIEGEANTGATSSEYNGNTAMTMQQAMDAVVSQIGLADGQFAEYDGRIIIPDGSVWHNVIILDKDGEFVSSYYISDTTGEIKTVNEMNAYAYRDQQ